MGHQPVYQHELLDHGAHVVGHCGRGRAGAIDQVRGSKVALPSSVIEPTRWKVGGRNDTVATPAPTVVLAASLRVHESPVPTVQETLRTHPG